MDAHENIREVVKALAADEVERILEKPEVKDRIADIVHEQIGSVFGTLLEKLKLGTSTTRAGGRKQRCSKCLTPGHRATTCKETPETAASMKAAAQAAATVNA